eukprot:11192898-Lingulodinium_polyedra.AAC.1
MIHHWQTAVGSLCNICLRSPQGAFNYNSASASEQGCRPRRPEKLPAKLHELCARGTCKKPGAPCARKSLLALSLPGASARASLPYIRASHLTLSILTPIRTIPSYPQSLIHHRSSSHTHTHSPSLHCAPP